MLRETLVKLPTSGLVTDELMVRRLFEVAYGYVDHDKPDPANPFKTVTRHQVYSTTNTLKQQIKRLIDNDIPEKANMSIDEILKLPTDKYEMIVESIIDKRIREDEALTAAQQEIEDGITEAEKKINQQ